MKSFFTLGAIAALCQSAYCLNAGPYQIESANSRSEILTQKNPGQPLTFEPKSEGSAQIWHVVPTHGDYFSIRSEQGFFINCHNDDSSICSAGTQAQDFIPEFQGGTNYELVEEGSGLFLRITAQKTLELAGYDGSINEQFSLVPVQR